MLLTIVFEQEKTPLSAKRTATLNICSRGATLIRLSRRNARKDLNAIFNGDDRWRSSRGLAGGFRFYWLLRCTGPQLAAAQQKILVPFIATYFC